MPGRLMSNVYLARPVTLSGPSKRLTRVLRSAGFSGQAYFLAFAEGPDGRGPGAACGFWALATGHPLHAGRRFEDARERSTAADVAVEAFARLVERRAGGFLDQRDSRHDEARRAEAAHQR